MKPPIRIVTLQRGWVLVGYLQCRGLRYLLDGWCIRRWGTTRGLGQLAADGPQSGTVLDPRRGVLLHELQIISQDRVDELRWQQAMTGVEVSSWDS